MPHASLIVLTSPALFSPMAPVALAEVSITAPHAIVTQVAPDMTGPVMPISWSLTAVQDEQDTQQTGDRDPERDDDSTSEDEIIVDGTYGPVEGDLIGEFNETAYRITNDIDAAFTEPIAYGYRDALPEPLRDGLGNVVRNLSEPANFLNFLLQLKIGKAFETLGRFTINSTLGVGGLFDLAATPGIGLPYRRNGFANTLGFYGVEPGAYLYLPITGATTVRDLIGSTLDQAVLPVAIGRPFNRFEYTAPYFVISSLDSRLEVDEELARIGEAVDPYAARRDSYLARREREIALLKGEEPPPPPAILGEIEGTIDIDDEIDGDLEGEPDEDSTNEDDAEVVEEGVVPEDQDEALETPEISYKVDVLISDLTSRR